MSKGKFTNRLGVAIDEILERDLILRLLKPVSRSLFSPSIGKGNKYEWIKVMDADGMLVAQRRVNGGEGRAPSDSVFLRLGVVVQSEDATSQTKPNPLGKAGIAHLPNGIWVDVSGVDFKGRCRLDRLLVIFVLPDGAGSARRKKFKTASRNVENAAKLTGPEAIFISVKRGASADEIKNQLLKKARPFLSGRGRPPNGT